MSSLTAESATAFVNSYFDRLLWQDDDALAHAASNDLSEDAEIV